MTSLARPSHWTAVTAKLLLTELPRFSALMLLLLTVKLGLSVPVPVTVSTASLTPPKVSANEGAASELTFCLEATAPVMPAPVVMASVMPLVAKLL